MNPFENAPPVLQVQQRTARAAVESSSVVHCGHWVRQEPTRALKQAFGVLKQVSTTKIIQKYQC